MSTHQALGGRILTKPFMVLVVIWLIGSMYGVQRFFMDGMGAVSNLNGGFAWGIWVVYDVVIGTALACGGFALAFVIYVFNKGKYHPLVRPAILASLLGYALGAFGAFFDMGRFWQFYEIFLPWNWNFNSVMLEVGLCVATYVLILIIEFAPAVLEKFGKEKMLKSLNKVLFLFIALGVLLPTMHQSSLGSLLIAMGHKVHPLWQTMHFQPLLALLSALIMGFSIVVFEASASEAGFGTKSESSLMVGLGKAVIGLLVAFLLVRIVVLLVQGKLGLIFAGDFASVMFLLEMALFVFPLFVLLSPDRRSRASSLLIAAVCMLFAGTLYRFDAFLFTFDPGPGYTYFPSVPEIMITLSIIALELMVYLVVVKTLPIYH
ncbi:MAG: Ni/Fe-hydrogenase cytochrome b subunit, partial [Pseudomonadota bacterium]|nr:Ni/Fe-hydrogenase cytochrome b subunit [Pseudomonadota bacterium]